MRRMLMAAAVAAWLAGCDKSDTPGLEASLSDGSAVSLAGTWAFNADLSDKPPERPADSKPPEGDGPHGPGGPGGPGGPMGTPPNLVISQTEATITFSGGGPKALTLRTDGSVTSMNGPGGTMEISARWEGGALIVTRTLPRGGTATETYTRNGDQLTIRVKLSGVTPPEGRPAPPESMRRVFDLVR